MLPDHGGLDLPLPPPPEEGGCVEGRGCEAAAAAEVAAAAVNEAGDGRLLFADEGFPIFAEDEADDAGAERATPVVTAGREAAAGTVFLFSGAEVEDGCGGFDLGAAA